jgi:acetyl esterase
MKRALPFTAFLILCSVTVAQKPEPKSSRGRTFHLVTTELKTEQRIYKKTPQGDLKLHFHFPADWKAGDHRPGMIFFFGGGWKTGTAEQFIPQAEYFATRGLVTVRADYRVLDKHGTTPDIATADAKSAVRWLRGHAEDFGIDPAKIIGSGGSAGGHLAAAALLVEGFDAKTDDLAISSKPDALVLFNPALNLTLGNKARKFVDAKGNDIGKALSATAYLKQRTVPTVIVFGSSDGLKAHGDEFLKLATGLGGRCEEWVAERQSHGFFNRQPWTSATVIQADRFLASLGYLTGEPTLEPADASAVLKAQAP